MATIKVRLAEVPTDVLVWLVDQPPQLWWSPAQIAAALTPEDCDYGQYLVADALVLLRDMGYVVQNREIRMWAATVDGQHAVDKARADAKEN